MQKVCECKQQNKVGCLLRMCHSVFIFRAARAVLIDLACNYGNTDCVTEARDRFDAFMADPSVNR